MVPMQRARRAQAAVLSGVAIAIVGAVGALLGPVAFIYAAVALPVPLMVLWLASDVLRADELHGATAEPRAATTERTTSARRTAESTA